MFSSVNCLSVQENSVPLAFCSSSLEFLWGDILPKYVHFSLGCPNTFLFCSPLFCWLWSQFSSWFCVVFISSTCFWCKNNIKNGVHLMEKNLAWGNMKRHKIRSGGFRRSKIEMRIFKSKMQELQIQNCLQIRIHIWIQIWLHSSVYFTRILQSCAVLDKTYLNIFFTWSFCSQQNEQSEWESCQVHFTELCREVKIGSEIQWWRISGASLNITHVPKSNNHIQQPNIWWIFNKHLSKGEHERSHFSPGTAQRNISIWWYLEGTTKKFLLASKNLHFICN